MSLALLSSSTKRFGIIVLAFLGVMNIGSTQIWRICEGNAITMATTNCRGMMIHEKEVREKLADSICNFIDLFANNKMYIVKFIICNTLSSLVFVMQLLTLTYVTGIYNEPSAIVNVFKWVMINNVDRTDFLSEIFPKLMRCLFNPYGTAGKVMLKDIVCTAPTNSMQEFMHIIAIYIVGAFAILNLIDYLLITLAIVFFKQSNTGTNKVIKRLAKFTLSQSLLCILIRKNLDIVLWEEILDQLAYTTGQKSKTKAASENSKTVDARSEDDDGISLV